jgi:hypothetical protein
MDFRPLGSRDFLRDENLIDIQTFEFIDVDKLDLRVFNKFIKSKSLTLSVLNNSDYNSLLNVGRTIIYQSNDSPLPYVLMIIDLEHSRNYMVKATLRNIQIDKITNK